MRFQFLRRQLGALLALPFRKSPLFSDLVVSGECQLEGVDQFLALPRFGNVPENLGLVDGLLRQGEGEAGLAGDAGGHGEDLVLEAVAGDDGKPRKTVKGDLIGLEGDTVAVQDSKVGRISFPLDLVHSAKLVLTDRLIAATRPLDTTGADEILEEEEG